MFNGVIFVLLLVLSKAVVAGDIRVAVASNFSHVMKQIAMRFEQQTGHRVIVSPGSTGKHYAQIINAAPFDIYLAADSRRPELLDRQGIAIAGSRYTYAIGRLLLWSKQKDLVDAKGEVLNTTKFNHLAIANPKLAPYGRAAQQALQQLNLWKALRARMVRGENIGQAFQFVKSGNAQLGFVAASQVQNPDQPEQGSLWAVPRSSYSPINQQAVLLTDSKAASELFEFIRSTEIKKLIHQYGYDLP